MKQDNKEQTETFEEKFPELAKVHSKGCITFTDKCLMMNCLSKQRVREVIKKLDDEYQRIDGEYSGIIIKDDLLKELELND